MKALSIQPPRPGRLVHHRYHLTPDEIAIVEKRPTVTCQVFQADSCRPT